MKSKRKNNLIKKTIEFEKMFDLDICIIIRDREVNKIYQYMSGQEETGYFNIYKAAKTVQQEVKLSREYQVYTRDDYSNVFRTSNPIYKK